MTTATLTRSEFIRECNRRRDLGLSLSGNTYPIRDAIKAAGGIWDSKRESWLLPTREALQELAAMMEAAPAPRPVPHHRNGRARRPWTSAPGLPCAACGRTLAASCYREGEWYCPDAACRRGHRETPAPLPVAAAPVALAPAPLPVVMPTGRCYECSSPGPAGDPCRSCFDGCYV